MMEMYPRGGRVILHVDMNSFYASVEAAYDSSLKGKPLAIAGNVEERRGIIVTCSYEARKFGVKTAMPLWEAKKLCPELIVKKPNFERYRAASIGMFEILRQYSELVEPVSIDEGYLDITESTGFESPMKLVETIQKRILEQLDLPCSIGVAPNKFLAKMASNMKKPMGITILRKRDIKNVLWPMDIEQMHGVGSKTAEKLRNLNIHKIGDLANGNEVQIRSLLGINGTRLIERANGVDLRRVDPDAVSDFKSIGNSTTLPKDTTNQLELFRVIEKLSEKVSVRLKNKQVLATTISITIRYKDRKTFTRSKKLENPLSGKEEIAEFSKKLFLKHWTGDAVRLLGITGTDLVEQKEAVKQLDLFSFEKDAKKEPLINAMQKLREKYGDSIIEHANNRPLKKENHTIGTDTSFNKDFLRNFNDKEK
ncbi:DNA polymerase IV [Cytobacillus sp. FJAT-54145]|uniref:DNA polymerase IV n=1 Tax=Cytobacillus spartinae TaxID=3299023 RepID=A0ABW6KG67_9BACI